MIDKGGYKKIKKKKKKVHNFNESGCKYLDQIRRIFFFFFFWRKK